MFTIRLITNIAFYCADPFHTSLACQTHTLVASYKRCHGCVTLTAFVHIKWPIDSVFAYCNSNVMSTVAISVIYVHRLAGSLNNNVSLKTSAAKALCMSCFHSWFSCKTQYLHSHVHLRTHPLYCETPSRESE